MSWRRWAIAAIALAFVMVVAWQAIRVTHPAILSRSTVRPTRVVPESLRIKVEVLNATESRGLARRAMFVLRDAGFDVVYFGNTAERSDSSIVRDRSGHPAWAALAATAVGGARVEAKPDSSHFLDLTILVGRNWAPPREALHP